MNDEAGAFGGLFGLISEPATMAIGYLFTAMGLFVAGESSLLHDE